jgi:hypothetical protein
MPDKLKTSQESWLTVSLHLDHVDVKINTDFVSCFLDTSSPCDINKESSEERVTSMQASNLL